MRLVRRHCAELEWMFAGGWAIASSSSPGPHGCQTGLGRDATRPLLRRNEKVFTPGGYALPCLTIAALSRGKNQLLVDELVAEVWSAAVDAGLDVDLDAIADRRALYAAFSVPDGEVAGCSPHFDALFMDVELDAARRRLDDVHPAVAT